MPAQVHRRPAMADGAVDYSGSGDSYSESDKAPFRGGFGHKKTKTGVRPDTKIEHNIFGSVGQMRLGLVLLSVCVLAAIGGALCFSQLSRDYQELFDLVADAANLHDELPTTLMAEGTEYHGKAPLGSAGSPFMTAFSPPNAAMSGGVTVTISGLSFATSDYTATVSTVTAEGPFCTTTAWTSGSSVQCNLPSTSVGKAQKLYYRGEVQSDSGVRASFTFDSASRRRAASPASRALALALALACAWRRV